MSCLKRREGDEFVCCGCALRWSVADDKPETCGRELVYQGSSKGRFTSTRADNLESLPKPDRTYTGEERRRKLREALDSLAKSPGAKWKERK